MKKNVFFMVLFTVLLVFPFSIKAFCNNNDKVKMISLANNINSNYFFDNESKTFKIILNNIPEGFIVVESNGVQHSYYNEQLEFYGYQPGKSYQFDISTVQDGCYGDVLKTIYVTLPMYNSNYTSPLCEGLEKYDICQKWGKYISDRTEFEKQVNKIRIDVDETVEEEKNAMEYKGMFDYLAEFFVGSYYIVLPIVIIAGLFAIYKLNKKGQLF